MSEMEDYEFSEEKFSGNVRLFPLPNLVLFPNILQTLHIYEPRYCQLFEDALADNRLIAMATLMPNWEKDYEGKPDLYPIACIGYVKSFATLPDGKYNLLLAGLRRVEITEERESDKQYRVAKVKVCDDEYPAGSDIERQQLKKELYHQFRAAIPSISPQLPEARQQLEQIIDEDISLGALTDIISYTFELTVEQKITLLTETNVDCRVALLTTFLEKLNTNNEIDLQSFPPGFSEN